MRFKCIVVIAALAYDFENSHLLSCAGLSESTKMRRRMVEMCVTVILLITFVEIKRHGPMCRAQSWPLPITFHLVPLDSYWIVIGSCF